MGFSIRSFHRQPAFALVVILVFFAVGLITTFGLTHTANVTGNSVSSGSLPKDGSLFYSQPLHAGGLINATRALDFSQRAMTPRQAAELAVRTMQHGQEIVIICGQIEEGVGKPRCFLAEEDPAGKALKDGLQELAQGNRT